MKNILKSSDYNFYYKPMAEIKLNNLHGGKQNIVTRNVPAIFFTSCSFV